MLMPTSLGEMKMHDQTAGLVCPWGSTDPLGDIIMIDMLLKGRS